MVVSDSARASIKAAEIELGKGAPDYKEVFHNVSCAFAVVFGVAGPSSRIRLPHKRRYKADEVRSYQHPRDAFGEVLQNFRGVESEIDRMYQVINGLESEMRIFSLGISAVELDRFNFLVPLCTLLPNGRLTGPTWIWEVDEKDISEDARFALDFCLQSILLDERQRTKRKQSAVVE